VSTFAIIAVSVLAVAAVGLGWWFWRRRRRGSRTFEGTFRFGWEVSSFVPGPPGNDRPRYWVAWTPESRFMEKFREQGYDPNWSPGYGTVRTKFVGTLEDGASNGYGHLGQYAGQVTVERVISMSPADLET
jgi:hypothetical protein